MSRFSPSPHHPAPLPFDQTARGALSFIWGQRDTMLLLGFVPASASLGADLMIQFFPYPIPALIGLMLNLAAHCLFSVAWLDFCLRGRAAGTLPHWDGRAWRYLLWMVLYLIGGIYGAYAIWIVLGGGHLLALALGALALSLVILRLSLVFPAISQGRFNYSPLQSWRDLKGNYRSLILSMLLVQLPFILILVIHALIAQRPGIQEQFVLSLSLIGIVIEYMTAAAMLTLLSIFYRAVASHPDGSSGGRS